MLTKMEGFMGVTMIQATEKGALNSRGGHRPGQVHQGIAAGNVARTGQLCSSR